MYRGKDFLPPSVAAALAERLELTKDVQEVEEKARIFPVVESCNDRNEGHALAGTLAEFLEAQARWGREVTAEEKKAMKEEASKAESARLFKRIEHKLHIVSQFSSIVSSEFSFPERQLHHVLYLLRFSFHVASFLSLFKLGIFMNRCLITSLFIY